MKILLTGTTYGQSTGFKKYSIMTGIVCLTKALKEMGHEVDYKVVRADTNLDEYDKVFVALYTASSLASSGYLNCMRVLVERPDAITLADDFNTKPIFKEYKAFNENPEKLFRPFTEKLFTDYDVIYNNYKNKILDKMANFNHKIMATILGKGDLSELGMPTDLVIPYDPTSYMQRYEKQDVIKEKKWLLATLSNNDAWLAKQKFSWPVQVFSSKNKIPEPDLMYYYNKCLGVISQKHAINKTGWWRPRFIFAMDAGSILYCQPDEAACYGDAYKITKEQIEQGSELDHKNIIEAQAECLNSLIWTKDRLHKEIENVINN